MSGYLTVGCRSSAWPVLSFCRRNRQSLVKLKRRRSAFCFSRAEGLTPSVRSARELFSLARGRSRHGGMRGGRGEGERKERKEREEERYETKEEGTKEGTAPREGARGKTRATWKGQSGGKSCRKETSHWENERIHIFRRMCVVRGKVFSLSTTTTTTPFPGGCPWQPPFFLFHLQGI